MSAIQQVMMALGGTPVPKFVSAGTPSRVANNATNALPAPGTISDGNRLLAILVSDNSSRTISTGPSGFNLVYSDGSGGVAYYVYEKTASSESGSYSFLWNGISNNTGVILCYENANDEAPGTAGVATSTTATAPSITPSAEGVLLQIFATRQARTVATPPSGTQRAVYTANGPSLAIYEITPQLPSPTGDKTLVWSSSSDVMGHLIQLTT